MKRKLVSFGVFSPQIVRGQLIQDTTMQIIYNNLKKQGFKETHWQFIYDHQLAGLVMPYNDGRNEIHVRFYTNRIVAEFEIGRSYISHFFGPRYNANRFLLNYLSPYLTKRQKKIFEKLLCSDLLLEDELKMPNWNSATYTTIQNKNIKNSLLKIFHDSFIYLGWRTTFLFTTIFFFAFYSTENIVINIFFITIFIFIFNFLPSRNKP